LAINDFLLFATGAYGGGTPYVIDQPTYLASPELNAGFAAGIAQAPHLNKVWRQGTFVAHGVSQFISDALNIDVHDDGNAAAWVANFKQALNVWISGATGNAQPKAPPGGPWAGTNGTWQQASQAVLMSDLVGHYVPMAGMASTNPMTGSLYLNADPPGGVVASANNMAATKHYVDSVAGTAVGGNFLPLTGGTLHNPGAGNLLTLQVDTAATQNFIMFNDTTTGQWNCGVNAGNQFSINYGAVTAATGYFMCDATTGTVNIQNGDLNLNAQTTWQYITRPNNPLYNNLAIAQRGGGMLANLQLNASVTQVGSNLLITGWVIASNYGSDPLKVWANAGNNARVLFNVPNAREWSCGCMSDSSFAIADETGAAQRLVFYTTGDATMWGNLTVTGAITATGGVTHMDSTGLTTTSFHATSSVQIDGNLNVNGTADVWSTCSLHGTVYVAGVTTMNNTGIVTNNLHTTVSVQIDGNLNVSGNISTGSVMYTNWILPYSGTEVSVNPGAAGFRVNGNAIMQGGGTCTVSDAQGRGFAMYSSLDTIMWGQADANGNAIDYQVYITNTGWDFNLRNGHGFQKGGGTWNDINSDIRVKRDVVSYARGLNEIKQIRPVSYRLNEIPVDDRTFYGVVAQEIQGVMPETIVLPPRPRGVATEIDGEPLLGFNATPVLWAMLNAIKELAAKVETLEGAR
jgi:hypothetical protein